MVDLASLLFMASGALTYPLFFQLSLKKSLSIVSMEKVADGRVLLSLIILCVLLSALGYIGGSPIISIKIKA